MALLLVSFLDGMCSVAPRVLALVSALSQDVLKIVLQDSGVANACRRNFNTTSAGLSVLDGNTYGTGFSGKT